MVIATGDREDGRQLLLVGLSRENLRLLRQDRPIVITPETHPGCPQGYEILVMYGETEAAIAQRLRSLGAVTPETTVIAVPKQSDTTQ